MKAMGQGWRIMTLQSGKFISTNKDDTSAGTLHLTNLCQRELMMRCHVCLSIIWAISSHGVHPTTSSVNVPLRGRPWKKQGHFRMNFSLQPQGSQLLVNSLTFASQKLVLLLYNLNLSNSIFTHQNILSEFPPKKCQSSYRSQDLSVFWVLLQSSFA